MCVCVCHLVRFPKHVENVVHILLRFGGVEGDATRDAVDGREEDDDQLYDVARVAEWIRANAFERIAMQIPDDTLKNAANICRELKRELDDFASEPSTSECDDASDEKKKEKKKKDVFVLADTTFGSCCVDEVAALHHNADCIVHVGFSCCSASRLKRGWCIRRRV